MDKPYDLLVYLFFLRYFSSSINTILYFSHHNYLTLCGSIPTKIHYDINIPPYFYSSSCDYMDLISAMYGCGFRPVDQKWRCCLYWHRYGFYPIWKLSFLKIFRCSETKLFLYFITFQSSIFVFINVEFKRR